MGNFNYTDEQEKAIMDLENDIILGAGAGSGKTRVLVSRFINLLKQKKAQVDQIMALTFTKKAAAEMQERIRKEIIKEEENSKDFNDKKYWHEQKINLNKSMISTFHSFAANILRQYPVISNLDPEFQVLEETEASELLDEVVNDIIENGLNDEKESIMTLVDTYGLYTLADKLKSIYFEMRKDNLDVDKLVEKTYQSLENDRSQREDIKFELIRLIEDLIYTFDNEGAGGKTKLKMENLKADWPKLKEIIRTTEDVEEKGFSEIIGIKDIIKGRLAQNLNDKAKEIRELIKSDQFKSYFILKRAEEIIKPLTEVIQDIDELYSLKKARASFLDFFDLQDRLIKVLKSNPELIESINDQYKYIMVDEFQDNNPVQEEIIYLLGQSSKINIFLVGDPKQSIYRFRGADVRVFNRQKEEIKKRNGEVYKLTKNFRSRPSILNFVNFLFEQILANDPEIDYDNLSSFRTENDKDIELNIISENHFEESLNSEKLRRIEAELLAQKAAHLIDNNDFLIEEDGQKRKIKPKDIAYLFQSLSNIQLYENALLNKNISVNVVNGRGFFNQQVITDLINLIKVIENTKRDFELTALLRSPLCGLDDNEIYWLNKEKENHLWNHILKAAEININQEKLKTVDRFVKSLKRAKKLKDIKNPYLLIKEVLETNNYRESLKGDPNYKQRWANLEKSLAMIKEIYHDRNASLSEVLEHFEKNKENETREGQAELKSKKGSVQLMSVHQSKGLEFPVVMIPDLQRGLIHHNNISDLLIDNKDGLGIKVSTNQYKLGTPLYNSLKEREKELELFEKIRLFYVAITRAKDKLILSGYSKSDRKLSFEKSKSWLDWLACYLNQNDFRTEETIELGEEKKKLSIQVNVVKDMNFITNSDIEIKDESNDYEINNWNDLKEWEKINPKIKDIKITNHNYKDELSVTGLLEYNRCPRLYYLRYIKNIPAIKSLQKNNFLDKGSSSSSMDPLTRGIFVHRLYELSGLSEEPEQYLNQVKDELKVVDIKEQTKDQLISLVKGFQNREKKYLNDKPEIVKTFNEKQFTLNYENFYLKGMIDNIYQYKDKNIEIIDFKTNNIKKNEVKEVSKGYKLQLESYVLAVSKLFNKSQIKYRIEYLIPEVNYSKILKRDDILKIEKRIENIGNKISKANYKEDFPLNTASECEYCIYGKLCNK
ncbi:MAG: UvrD-helicase domain-containing protein [Halanaerobiales bacterium]|nr:UvrD-helicase domain-containing protein [Halanaerobiales bacterium]